MSVSTHFHTLDDGFVIERRQDVSAILDANRDDFNASPTRWGDGILDNKVASIPLAVVDELNRQGILRGFSVVDMTRFKAFMNHPDNRFFRTRPGRV